MKQLNLIGATETNHLMNLILTNLIGGIKMCEEKQDPIYVATKAQMEAVIENYESIIYNLEEELNVQTKLIKTLEESSNHLQNSNVELIDRVEKLKEQLSKEKPKKVRKKRKKSKRKKIKKEETDGSNKKTSNREDSRNKEANPQKPENQPTE